MLSRLDSNGYTGLHYTGRPDQKGGSLGLSGDVFAETAAGMAAVIASSGPMGPILVTQFALGVILASWFPIQVELVDTPGRDKCVLDPTPGDCDTAGAALDRNSGTA